MRGQGLALVRQPDMRQTMAGSRCWRVTLTQGVCLRWLASVTQGQPMLVSIPQLEVGRRELYGLAVDDALDLSPGGSSALGIFEQPPESFSVGLELSGDQANGGVENLPVVRRKGSLE